MHCTYPSIYIESPIFSQLYIKQRVKIRAFLFNYIIMRIGCMYQLLIRLYRLVYLTITEIIDISIVGVFHRKMSYTVGGFICLLVAKYARFK